MIHLVELALRQRILDLGITNQYGGHVRTVSVPTEDGVKRYPVSCFVSDVECFQGGMYNTMTPDSSKRGIIYFEQIGDIVEKGSTGAKARVLLYELKLRLVAYFNLALNGKSSPCRDLIFLPKIIKATKGDYEVVGDSYKGTQISIGAPNIVVGSQIFKDYSYDKTMVENLHLYPHMPYALDYKVGIRLPIDCHVEESQEPEITCLTTY